MVALLEKAGRALRRSSAARNERGKRRFVQARREHDPAVRELVEGRIGDWREDAYAAAGNGIASPGLPEATPSGVYHEFERDRTRPHDPAE